MLFAIQLLLAQANDAAQQTPQGGAGGSGGGIMMIAWLLVLVFFYFLVIRAPMRRQENERQTLLNNLKENDKVLTSGGIIGTIATLRKDTDEMTLKVDDKVRLRMTKSSIVRVLTDDAASEAIKEKK
jgi:preprotein translocase subunit YajC